MKRSFQFNKLTPEAEIILSTPGHTLYSILSQKLVIFAQVTFGLCKFWSVLHAF